MKDRVVLGGSKRVYMKIHIEVNRTAAPQCDTISDELVKASILNTLKSLYGEFQFQNPFQILSQAKSECNDQEQHVRTILATTPIESFKHTWSAMSCISSIDGIPCRLIVSSYSKYLFLL
mmetsp:Transcript_12667/g.22805  ORF Transcript_12667/g.22805 Transcript_12667/m.22805 type:complete len:120 (-) Transcript_12667:1417-1776(-)